MTATKGAARRSRSDAWLFCYERDHEELSIMSSIRRLERKAAKLGSVVVQFILRHDKPGAILKDGTVID